MEKRIRLPNFDSKEESILLSLAEEHAHVIENKKTDAVTWEEKRRAWEKIAMDLEVRHGIKRNSKNLKEKYDNLKRKAKKSLAEERREIYKTGGGQFRSTVDPSVERLAALMGRSATGYSNHFDSDAIISSGLEAAVEEKLNESNESASMKDYSKDPEVLENMNSGENCANWSSWNPELLKNRKSAKLTSKCSERKSKKAAFNPQYAFWKNEEERSAEKHGWERANHKRQEEKHNWLAEKHSWEKTHASLKTQILELELELKAQQLQ